MVASGTFTPGGDLGNSTGTYSQESFSMPDMHSIKQVSFIFTSSNKSKARGIFTDARSTKQGSWDVEGCESTGY